VDSLGTADERIAVRGDASSDRPSDQLREVTNRRWWRERFGHESEADFGEAHVEGRIVDTAPRPVNQADLAAVDEHVGGPQIAVNQR
jgi:hypothetical protein